MSVEVCPWCGRPCTSDHPDKCSNRPRGGPWAELARTLQLLRETA